MSLVTALLPRSGADFIVFADTHFMVDGAAHAAEFPSRRKQNARIAAALELIDEDEVSFAVHLGDHVQDVPGSATFDQTMAGALAQLRAGPVPIYHAAGNTDVGDKADPVSPGIVVSSEAVTDYHAAVGSRGMRQQLPGCIWSCSIRRCSAAGSTRRPPSSSGSRMC